MDHDTVQRWLDDYVEAWRTYDRERIAALFTDDAAYRYHPYDEPVVGAAAIADDWLKHPDAPGTWQANYSPLAVDGDTAVAVGTSSYDPTDDAPARTYSNCYVMRFDDSGRCREFTEWFMKHPD